MELRSDPRIFPGMVRPAKVAALALMVLVGLRAADQGNWPAARRAVSPHMARVLADAARKAQPPTPTVDGAPVGTSTANEARPRLADDAPANTIVRLPAYIVRERKLPNAEEVLTLAELEKVAMRRFLGEETGLNRALSTVTFKHLWKRIPVLGRFPLLEHETNEERAIRLYRLHKEAEAWEHVLDMQRMERKLKPGTGPLKQD